MLAIVELHAGKPKDYDMFNSVNISSINHNGLGMTIWQTDGKKSTFPIYIDDPSEVETISNSISLGSNIVVVYQGSLYGICGRYINLGDAINICKMDMMKKWRRNNMLTIVELSEDGKIMKRIRVLNNIVAVESTETGVEIVLSTGKTYQYSLTFGLIDIGRMQAAMRGTNYGMVIWKDQYHLDCMCGWTNHGFVERAKSVMTTDEE